MGYFTYFFQPLQITIFKISTLFILQSLNTPKCPLGQMSVRPNVRESIFKDILVFFNIPKYLSVAHIFLYSYFNKSIVKVLFLSFMGFVKPMEYEFGFNLVQGLEYWVNRRKKSSSWKKKIVSLPIFKWCDYLFDVRHCNVRWLKKQGRNLYNILANSPMFKW